MQLGLTHRLTAPPLEISQQHNISQPVKEGQLNGVTCVLTVPLWVLKKCATNRDLFDHLVGEEKLISGCKIRKMRYNEKTLIKLSRCDRKKNLPLVITITSKKGIHTMLRAKKLIIGSLLDFLPHPCLERILVYEMGMTAGGTFQNEKVDGAVRQFCYRLQKTVWMKVLRLKRCWRQKTNGTENLLHSFVPSNHLQLISGTNCYIEVYGLSNDTPMLRSPYVFIGGNGSEEVNEVAARVSCLLKNHQNMSYDGLPNQNDDSPTPKRRKLSDAEILSDHPYPTELSNEHPRKALKAAGSDLDLSGCL